MSSKGSIRAMVVDDHPIVVNGLREVLEASGRIKVVGQAGDGEEAVRVARELKPDVVVMDVMMPRMDGIESCREIMDLLPATRVMMLSAATEEDAVIEAIAAGATGYLQKYSRPKELLQAVLDVAEDRLRIPDKVTRQVFAMLRGQQRRMSAPPLDKLTTLEQETLRLFARGKSYAQIAEARGRKTVTVRNTLYRIQSKLRIDTKRELVVWAVRNGLMDDVVVGEEEP